MVRRTTLAASLAAVMTGAALSLPPAACALDIPAPEQPRLSTTVPREIVQAGLADEATYAGAVTTVKSLPEFLSGITLTGNSAVVEKADGTEFTIQVDPSAVSGALGLPGSTSGGTSAQFEIVKWCAVAFMLFNVVSAFFRMISNARRAFGRRVAAPVVRQVR